MYIRRLPYGVRFRPPSHIYIYIYIYIYIGVPGPRPLARCPPSPWGLLAPQRVTAVPRNCPESPMTSPECLQTPPRRPSRSPETPKMTPGRLKRPPRRSTRPPRDLRRASGEGKSLIFHCVFQYFWPSRRFAFPTLRDGPRGPK